MDASTGTLNPPKSGMEGVELRVNELSELYERSVNRDVTSEDTDSVAAGGGGGPTQSARIFRIGILFLQQTKCLLLEPGLPVRVAKQAVVQGLAQAPPDELNYGLFLPASRGRVGKFLDEERLLGDYPPPDDSPVPYLEFRYKRRLYKQTNVDEKLITKLNTKVNQKKFMELTLQLDTEHLVPMLDRGLDPNFHDSEKGDCPLTAAAQLANSTEVVKALVCGGAHLDFCARDGLTALHKAARARNHPVLQTLLELGLSPDLRDSRGLSALYYSCVAGGEARSCETLLYERAQVGCADDNGWQEIHQTCRHGYVQHLELLLFYGADMSARNASGNTALHIAAIYDQESCTQVLLFRGADKEVKNFNSQNPFQVAIVAGNFDLAETIKVHKSTDVVPFNEAPPYSDRRRRFSIQPTAMAAAAAMAVTASTERRLLRSSSEKAGRVTARHAADVPAGVATASAQASTAHFSCPWPEARTEWPRTSSEPRRGQSEQEETLRGGSLDAEQSNYGSSRTLDRPRSGGRHGRGPGGDLRASCPKQSCQRNLDNALPGRAYAVQQAYRPRRGGEIPLAMGDLVHVLTVGEAGMWEGISEGRRGWFPSHCVREVQLRQTQAVHEDRTKRLLKHHTVSSFDGLRKSSQCPFPERTVVLHKKDNDGFGFVLRGAKANVPVQEFTPSAAFPALQYLESVDEDGVASRAGLKVGDFLIEVNGENVVKAGHRQVVQMIRQGGNRLELKVITVSHPPNDDEGGRRKAPMPPKRAPSTGLSSRSKLQSDELDETAAAAREGLRFRRSLLPPRAEKLDALLAAAATVAPHAAAYDNAAADSRAATVRQRPTSRRLTPGEICELIERQGARAATDEKPVMSAAPRLCKALSRQKSTGCTDEEWLLAPPLKFTRSASVPDAGDAFGGIPPPPPDAPPPPPPGPAFDVDQAPPAQLHASAPAARTLRTVPPRRVSRPGLRRRARPAARRLFRGQRRGRRRVRAAARRLGHAEQVRQWQARRRQARQPLRHRGAERRGAALLAQAAAPQGDARQAVPRGGQPREAAVVAARAAHAAPAADAHDARRPVPRAQPHRHRAHHHHQGALHEQQRQEQPGQQRRGSAVSPLQAALVDAVRERQLRERRRSANFLSVDGSNGNADKNRDQDRGNHRSVPARLRLQHSKSVDENLPPPDEPEISPSTAGSGTGQSPRGGAMAFVDPASPLALALAARHRALKGCGETSVELDECAATAGNNNNNNASAGSSMQPLYIDTHSRDVARAGGAAFPESFASDLKSCLDSFAAKTCKASNEPGAPVFSKLPPGGNREADARFEPAEKRVAERKTVVMSVMEDGGGRSGAAGLLMVHNSKGPAEKGKKKLEGGSVSDKIRRFSESFTLSGPLTEIEVLDPGGGTQRILQPPSSIPRPPGMPCAQLSLEYTEETIVIPAPLARQNSDVEEDFVFTDPLPPPIEFMNEMSVDDPDELGGREIAAAAAAAKARGGRKTAQGNCVARSACPSEVTSFTVTSITDVMLSVGGGGGTGGMSRFGPSPPHDALDTSTDSGMEEMERGSCSDHHLETTSTVSTVSSISTLSSEGGETLDTCTLYADGQHFAAPDRPLTLPLPPVPPKPKHRSAPFSGLYRDLLVKRNSESSLLRQRLLAALPPPPSGETKAAAAENETETDIDADVDGESESWGDAHVASQTKASIISELSLRLQQLSGRGAGAGPQRPTSPIQGRKSPGPSNRYGAGETDSPLSPVRGAPLAGTPSLRRVLRCNPPRALPGCDGGARSDTGQQRGGGGTIAAASSFPNIATISSSGATPISPIKELRFSLRSPAKTSPSRVPSARRPLSPGTPLQDAALMPSWPPLPSDRPFTRKPLHLWTKYDVGDWLESLNLAEHRESFLDNEIDGTHLPALQKEDLLELGVTRVGHRMNIERALRILLDR
ncbi:unnamed protein product [Lampetra planeri]